MLTCSRFRTPAALILIVGGLVLAAGCRSNDEHTYKSHVYRPTTVTVVKTPSQEPIWSYDVPGGYVMALDFDSDTRPQRNYVGGPNPTQMNWALYGPETGDVWGVRTESPVATDVVAMPGTTVAILVTYREPDAPAATTVEMPPTDVEVSDQGVTPVTPEEAARETAEPDENTKQ